MPKRLFHVVMACSFLVGVASASDAQRVSASKKGSLLVYSKVELKWDATGRLTQDTFLDLTNDYPRDVLVQLYFINGDAPLDAVEPGGILVERWHPGWNWVDCQIMLTRNEPTYWSVLTGMNSRGGVCQPFTVLDPGNPPGRPDLDGPPGSRVLRGYVYAWAVNEEGKEIRWNHLKGDVVIVNYAKTAAWEYNAWAYQALRGAPDELPGMRTDRCVITGVECDTAADCPIAERCSGTAGDLQMDGNEYDISFDKLLLDFYASGSDAFSRGGVTVQVDTDLTLHPVSADLRQETSGPVTTKANFFIWNMNETQFSGTHRCITCWDQTLLSKYTRQGIANHFMRNNLHTDKGKARINGIYSPSVCSGSEEAAILGVAAKMLVFSGATQGVAFAGMTLVGQGEQDSSVQYDVIPPPDDLINAMGTNVPGGLDVAPDPMDLEPAERAPVKESRRGR